MKKLLIGLVCLLAFSFFTVEAAELPKKTDHEIVTIYIFRGSGCSHCYEALEYFTNFFEANPEYKDYVQLKAYEVWQDANNSNLMQAVAKKYGDEVGGVPYIVVGESYHSTGFASQLGPEIIDAALEEYENKKYKDVVAEVAKTVDDETVTTLEEAAYAEGIVSEYSASNTNESEDNHNADAWIVAGIFVVIFGGIFGLVALSKKKN